MLAASLLVIGVGVAVFLQFKHWDEVNNSTPRLENMFMRLLNATFFGFAAVAIIWTAVPRVFGPRERILAASQWIGTSNVAFARCVLFVGLIFGGAVAGYSATSWYKVGGYVLTSGVSGVVLVLLYIRFWQAAR
jgi:hypothetical protein